MQFDAISLSRCHRHHRKEAFMNVWIVLLIGVIIGWIIGVIIVRQNYQTCKNQIALLKRELVENDEKLQAATKTLDVLTEEVEEKESQLQSIVHR
jgi:uncharacterized membrane-anchored protein YhcB (DUF1043 family)